MENVPLDIELQDLPPDLRWRHWMGRIEAVIFASATPVPREDLARLVGQGASVDLLIGDIRGELQARPYELVQVADGWMMRTKAQFGDAIRSATNLAGPEFSAHELAVLATIAYQQPISRAGLREVFGQDIARDLITRLRLIGLIATGPRSPKPGAPYTFVTTRAFLAVFGLQSLRDLPDQEGLEDAGLVSGPGSVKAL